MIGLAAAAAVVALLYMRKGQAAATVAGTSGVISSGSNNAGSLAAALSQAASGASALWPGSTAPSVGYTKPARVSDPVAAAPAPKPTPVPKPTVTESVFVAAAPAPVPSSGGAVFGAASTGNSQFDSTVSPTGLRTYADGSTHQMTDGELYVFRLQQSGKNPAAALGYA